MTTFRIFCLFSLFSFINTVECYCKCITRNPFIKITKIEPLFIKPAAKYSYDDEENYYIENIEKWDHGEVSWDFPENNMNNMNSMRYYSYSNSNSVSTYDNSIYEKYFKNRLYLRIRKSYIKEVSYTFIKYAYKDIVKLETFVSDIQDFAFNNIRGTNVESDLALLVVATGLGVLYNKNKAESIETLKLLQQSNRKNERLETEKQIRRNTSIFFVILMTIFGRNIKNAE
jgi:hypothetical protein